MQIKQRLLIITFFFCCDSKSLLFQVLSNKKQTKNVLYTCIVRERRNTSLGLPKIWFRQLFPILCRKLSIRNPSKLPDRLCSKPLSLSFSLCLCDQMRWVKSLPKSTKVGQTLATVAKMMLQWVDQLRATGVQRQWV